MELLGYAETLRLELAEEGIGVTAICPGISSAAIFALFVAAFSLPRSAATVSSASAVKTVSIFFLLTRKDTERM